jgi:hypothetical protein
MNIKKSFFDDLYGSSSNDDPDAPRQGPQPWEVNIGDEWDELTPALVQPPDPRDNMTEAELAAFMAEHELAGMMPEPELAAAVAAAMEARNPLHAGEREIRPANDSPREDNTVYLPDAVRETFAQVRGLYEAGLGSGNKAYLQPVDPNQVEANKRSVDAAATIHAGRTDSGVPTAVSRRCFRDEISAGDSLELSFAAADRAQEAGLAVQVWTFGPDTQDIRMPHHVAVVARTPAALDAVAPSSNPQGAATYRAWVIDPWMNVCCRLSDYPSRAQSEMEEWAREGIGIRNDANNTLVNAREEGWIDAIRTFPTQADRDKSNYMSMALLDLPSRRGARQVAQRHEPEQAHERDDR